MSLNLRHLALAVTDQVKSRHFYEYYFGFNTKSAKSYPEGILILRDNHHFSLALGLVERPPVLPEFFHFGFVADSPAEVCALRKRLADDGIEITEEHNDPDYVSVEVKDPDGYVVEAFWQPQPGDTENK